MSLNEEDLGVVPAGEIVPNGTLIADRYETLKLIGSGSMGAVYVVRDSHLNGALVALKLVHSSIARDTRHFRRFLSEIEITRQVNHKNIVRTFDIGRWGEREFFTMELVHGDPLCHRKRFHFPEEEDAFIQTVDQIVAGLGELHRMGICHRDLKPENVLLDPEGRIKIIDLGVAKRAEVSLTLDREILGTASYIAPEVWEGQPSTPAADFYSLGAIMYECVTGEILFDSDDLAKVMWQHINLAVTPPKDRSPSIPDWLNLLILQLLSKSPHARPQTAAEIHSILSNKATTPGVPSSLTRSTPAPLVERINGGRKHKVKLGILAAIICWLGVFSAPKFFRYAEGSALRSECETGERSWILEGIGVPLSCSPAGLVRAIRSGDSEGVGKLLAAGVNPNQGVYNFPLYEAVRAKHFDIATALLLAGANPNVRDETGFPLLHFIIGNIHAEPEVEFLERFLRFGADVNIDSPRGVRALDLANSSHVPAVAEVLLRLGAKPSIKATQSVTPIEAPPPSAAPTPAPSEPPQKVKKAATQHREPASTSPKLTQLRMRGEASLTRSQGQITGARCELRNVGDFPATKIAVSVKIRGELHELKGPSTLGPNDEHEYLLKLNPAVSSSESLRLEVSCENCHRSLVQAVR